MPRERNSTKWLQMVWMYWESSRDHVYHRAPSTKAEGFVGSLNLSKVGLSLRRCPTTLEYYSIHRNETTQCLAVIIKRLTLGFSIYSPPFVAIRLVPSFFFASSLISLMQLTHSKQATMSGLNRNMARIDQPFPVKKGLYGVHLCLISFIEVRLVRKLMFYLALQEDNQHQYQQEKHARKRPQK